METNPQKLPLSLSPWSSSARASKFIHGELSDQIIACAIEVHRELGPGFLESIYEEAFSLELNRRRIQHCRQFPIDIRFHGVVVGTHRIDHVIDNKIVVELKAVRAIDDAHLATCLSYLKATNLCVGLIINFAEPKTRIRRVMRGSKNDRGVTESGSF